MGQGDLSEQARKNPELVKKSLLEAKPEPYQPVAGGGENSCYQKDGPDDRSGHRRDGENEAYLPVKWDASSSNSPISSPVLCQRAFFPSDSIIGNYYDYVITQSEG